MEVEETLAYKTNLTADTKIARGIDLSLNFFHEMRQIINNDIRNAIQNKDCTIT